MASKLNSNVISNLLTSQLSKQLIVFYECLFLKYQNERKTSCNTYKLSCLV